MAVRQRQGKPQAVLEQQDKVMRVEILLAQLEIMVLGVAAVHLRLVETAQQVVALVVQVRHLQ